MPRERLIGPPDDGRPPKDPRLCSRDGCFEVAGFSRSTLGGSWVCGAHFGFGDRQGGGADEPRRAVDFLPATDAAEP